MVAEDKKEVNKIRNGKVVKDIDEKELHERASCMRRSKEEKEGREAERNVLYE